MGQFIASRTYDAYTTSQGRTYLGTYDSIQAVLQDYPDAIYEPDNDSVLFGMVGDGEVLIEDAPEDEVVVWDGVTRPIRQCANIAYQNPEEPHYRMYIFFPEQRQEVIDEVQHSSNEWIIWPDGTQEHFPKERSDHDQQA